MTTGSARVAVPCPACSPNGDTVHEVVSPGERATVRCGDCDHVHKTRIPPTDRVQRPVIVSQGDESTTGRVTMPSDEELAVGEEFVVETDAAVHEVRITSLELDGDRRADRARVDEVATIWTRAVDNVAVNVTIHPGDGRRADSRSRTIYRPGDYEFTVGSDETMGEERVRVTGLNIVDDAVGYRRPTLRREGDAAFAKDVKRLYAEARSADPWSAW